MRIWNTDTYKNRGRALGFGATPEGDWRVMFSLFVLLLILSAGLCIAFFRNVENGGNADESTQSQVPIDPAILHSTGLYYEKQKLDFESVERAPETTPDPSHIVSPAGIEPTSKP